MSEVNVTSYLGEIELQGEKVDLNLQWQAEDASPEAGEKIFELTAKARKSIFSLVQKEIRQLGEIITKDEDPLSRLTRPAFLQEVEKLIEEGQAAPVLLPDPYLTDIPEAPIEVEDIGRAEFYFTDAPQPQDAIPFGKAPKTDDSSPLPSRADLIREKTRLLAEKYGVEYDPEKEKTRDSYLGISNSLVPRDHYESVLTPKGSLASFLKRTAPFISRDVFAFNGMNGERFIENGEEAVVERAVSSSFNRFAEEPTMMRYVEAENGTIDCYAGRVDTKGDTPTQKAEQMIQYLFTNQMAKKKKHLGGGGIKIHDAEKKICRLRCAVQSLMNVKSINLMSKEEWELYESELEAYRLLQEKSPLTIFDPDDPEHPYTVYLDPIPIAANQFNTSNMLEHILPDTISGELTAKKQSDKADQVLCEWAKDAAIDDPEQRKQIEDTIYHLQNGELEPEEVILARAFLCRLLDIPLIVHCRSSVDRTDIEIPMITAMNQWIRAKQPIPVDENGRTAVFRLLKVEAVKADGTSFSPYKELLAFNMHKELKVSEFSRGKKGFKYGRGILQHPSLKNLLPERYLKQKEAPGVFKRWVGPALAAIVVFALVLPLLYATYTALRDHGAKGLLVPFIAPVKFVWNANHLFSSALLDEDFPGVGERKLIYRK